MRVKGTNDRNERRRRVAVGTADRLCHDRLTMPQVFRRYSDQLEVMPEKARAEWIERFITHAHERGPMERWTFAVSRTMRSHWKRAEKMVALDAARKLR